MGAQERKRQKKIREYVVRRDGQVCCYCEQPLIIEKITMEHIVPDSKRGTFNSTNLTVSCYECNNSRGDRPFFDYIKNFNFSESKIEKYRKMYFNNLRIKILNIAKEECLKEEKEIPQELIKQACQILKIKYLDFSDYENRFQFEIKFSELSDRKKIKYCFEILIRLLEADSE